MFEAPAIDWAHLAPIVIVLGAAVLSVLVEAFVPARARRVVQVGLSILAIAGAGAWSLILALRGDPPTAAFGGHLAIDPMALAIQVAVAVSALLAILVLADKTRDGEDAFTPQAASAPGSLHESQAVAAKVVHTEVFALTLFATGGMMVFPAAADLLTMFVALEVLSLPLYLLTGLARRRRLLSQEASLKYFLLGAFASAFFLFGAAWVFGATGTVKLSEVFTSLTGQTSGADIMAFAGLVLIIIGLAFKIGAAPFHVWTPDVYQGAPLPVTAFMAACTKIAAFGALLRIVYGVAAPLQWDLGPALWTLTALTMVVGTVVAMTQQNIVRMLAYSAIAHAGFILAGVVSLTSAGLGAVIFYLLGYGVATVGGFAVVSLVREHSSAGGVGAEATGLDQWRGLGKTNPVLATAMSLFLLTFAGIPLTSGFIGKFAVFSAAFEGGAWPLAVTGIACSAAAAFFYARVIVAMFFAEPAESAGAGVKTLGLTQTSIGLAAAITLVLGVYPGPVLDFAEKAAALLS
jgi:NADH-quinone oxidoreductase subunit N